jgi:hypothetical protein
MRGEKDERRGELAKIKQLLLAKKNRAPVAKHRVKVSN